MNRARLASVLAVLLLGAGLLAIRGRVSASLEDPYAALRAGRYKEALEAFEKESTANPSPRLYRAWVEALRLTGSHDEALAVIARYETGEPSSVELQNRRGEILYAGGRLSEAREAFEKAIAGGAGDRWSAELNLAVLLYHQGEVEEAMARFDRFIDLYNETKNLSAEDLTAVAIACRYLGVSDHQLFKDALRAFDEAKAKDPENPIPAIRTGELFLEKYNSPDANESFQEVLRVNSLHPEALLGLAQVKDFDGSPEALELTKKALEINPRYVEARAFLAEQLLGLEDYDGARREAEAALEVNPVSRHALPILAAAELLSGRTEAFRAVEERAHSRNPRDASFYNKLSEISVNNRLYREARDFAQKAVELDPTSHQGYGLLGLNQLRLGEIAAGTENLVRSFEGDPYNVWIKNTLDLIDTYREYETIASERFEIFIDRKEAELLAVYVERIANEAFNELAERYDYLPATPIRVEVYSSHGDFSVRTLGLPGLGALGVCFGPVIAVDSPSARPRGQFNWASTLWHELAHTITLGATNHKVPRWLSEGLSVLEERRARPGWGDDVSLAFLAAYQRKKLLPVGELNNGFMRPTYPQQIGISYYQASLVAELIERDFGFQAIRDMLSSYRDGLSTEEVFGKVLSLSLSDFDARFEAYLKDRFDSAASALRLPPEEPSEGAPGAAPSPISPISPITIEELEKRAEADEFDFIAQLETGRRALEAGETEKAESLLERAKRLFPEYAEDGSPYLLLSRIHEERSDLERAASELQAFIDLNEIHYDAHLKLSELYQRLQRKEPAAEVLERAVFVYPFDAEAHRTLAELYRELGRKDDVVTERKALLALTTDKAQGLYDLALAHYEAGDVRNAKRELLRALEIAPGFREGLALLAKLSGAGEG